MPDARFQPLTGFRDFAPQECAERNYVFDTWRRVACRYGFKEWEAPMVEATDLYLKKTGGELSTQLFRFKDQGDRDITLRPELTASLGRIVAGYQREYGKPLKWFEIGNCFRYEKPQRGRLREFYQFNADVLGESSPTADAELIALAIDCMRELGLDEEAFVVRVSDREAWVQFARARGVSDEALPMFLGVVDKLERDSVDECQRKLSAMGLQRADLISFIENPPSDASARYNVLRAELEARGMGQFVELDLSIVRGLAYYTGVVFEVFDKQKTLRAIAGGGRYDTLVSALSDGAVDMPATGFAMGDVVIAHLIEQHEAAKSKMQKALARGGCDVYVVQGSPEKRVQVLQVVTSLRNQGYSIDFPLVDAKINKQLQMAEKTGAKVAVIVGDDDLAWDVRLLATRERAVAKGIDHLLEILNLVIDN